MNQPWRTPNHVTMALNGQAYQECHRAQWQRVRSTNRKGVDLTTIGSTRSSFFRVCLNHSLTNNIFHLKSPHSNLSFSFISTLKKKTNLLTIISLMAQNSHQTLSAFSDLVNVFSCRGCRKLVHQIIGKYTHMRGKSSCSQALQHSVWMRW